MDKRGKPLDFFIPKNDSVYLYMDLREQKSSIIVTPESTRSISETGIIMAKGPKVSDEWKIGDRVMIHYFTGTHMQLKEVYAVSEFHRVVREHELLGKIDQEKREAYNKEE